MSLTEMVLFPVFMEGMKDVDRKTDVVEVMVFMSFKSGDEVAVVVIKNITRKTSRIAICVEKAFQPYLQILVVRLMKHCTK